MAAASCCCTRDGALGFAVDLVSRITDCSPTREAIGAIASGNSGRLGECDNLYDIIFYSGTGGAPPIPTFPSGQWADIIAWVEAGGRLCLIHEILDAAASADANDFLATVGTSMAFGLVQYDGGFIPHKIGVPADVPIMDGLSGVKHAGALEVTGGTPLLFAEADNTKAIIACEAVGDGFVMAIGDRNVTDINFGLDNCPFWSRWHDYPNNQIL